MIRTAIALGKLVVKTLLRLKAVVKSQRAFGLTSDRVTTSELETKMSMDALKFLRVKWPQPQSRVTYTACCNGVKPYLGFQDAQTEVRLNLER